MNGRASILNGIRRGLRRGPLPEHIADTLRARLRTHPRHLIPDRTNLPRRALVDLFVFYIQREYATVARVTDLDQIPDAIVTYLAERNLPSALAAAPHPELRGIDWSRRPLLAVREGRAEATDAVSLSVAFAGVAETGTLIMPSGPERPNTLNLLPDTEIVVLRASRIVAAYEDSWDRLRAETGGTMPRTVMHITGPSRSADIEQTMELGAHGPRRLHVLLVDDEPALA